MSGEGYGLDPDTGRCVKVETTHDEWIREEKNARSMGVPEPVYQEIMTYPPEAVDEIRLLCPPLRLGADAGASASPACLAAFRKTPCRCLVGGDEMLKYATQHGTGWRADCLGDTGGFSKTWCHMRMAYPRNSPRPRPWIHGRPRRWPGRLVGTCGSGSKRVGRCGSSSTTPWPCTAPASTTSRPRCRAVRTFGPKIERFLRRLGYRLVLQRVELRRFH